ncbi:hypothetical protein S7711_04645 [Stachybotrys chartarum IBT 7711]|uniref:Small nuclear ribonucleoprotein Prp3 C-terminal domain-containing protein n=1 Tax=Stachybotrys chartarum (strain CBS 109288 / IBT 7711) TaxID=1280523 RepID=A0A084B5Z2_STACB|nr:hypothetical protein S7711_04645 [Stachybotrys chartarum IBT 7711]
MSFGSQWALLPKELMELQLGQIELLQAMYESDNAIAMSETSLQLMERLKEWCEGEVEAPCNADSSVSMLLTLDMMETDVVSTNGRETIQLDLSVPLKFQGQEPTEPPPVRIRIRQPAWMSKADVAGLNDQIPDEDMLTAIEHIKQAAVEYLQKTSKSADLSQIPRSAQPTVRVWFYFPSISTRSKRDDLINHAPAYGLTGFLLAGKPGVLCVEGASQAIDDYMKFIKTESWGDIPPQHKKVSERYRESATDMARAFEDMQEITDLVGERRGERANRNDMKALEAWLTQRGLGEAFAKVLI